MAYRLSCGHYACGLCVDAWNMSDELGCPVCRKAEATAVPDFVLTAFAESVYQSASANESDAADMVEAREPPSSAVMEDDAPPGAAIAINEMILEFTRQGAELMEQAASASEDANSVLYSTALAQANLLEQVNNAKAALDAVGRVLAAKLSATAEGRVKELGIAVDERTVSAPNCVPLWTWVGQLLATIYPLLTSTWFPCETWRSPDLRTASPLKLPR